jgi:MFS transporter, DHA1 family, tetracycline resistance protein
VAGAGYGMATGLSVIILLLVIHGPEGFVHPMLSAIMSKAVPEDAQGELQGGISSIMSIAMLLGTIFFSQLFSHFMKPGGVLVSPDVSYFAAAAILALALVLYLLSQRQRVSAPQ